LNFEDWYNEKALEIWRNAEPEQELFPALLPKIKTDSEVLIIGINPSHDLDWINQNLARDEFKGKSVEEIFSWDKKKIDEKKQDVIRMEDIARNPDVKNRYFNAIDLFTKRCGFSSWEHLDLFLIRKTKQSDAMKLLGKNGALNDFGERQKELFFEAIEKLEIKTVVVTNALSSKIIHCEIFKNKKEIKTNIKHNGKHFFFASMLSGGAMDNFSKERLIREILEHKNAISVKSKT
jgi:hypothetical protein